MKKKSKLLTFILSFIPGLGQIYLNYTSRGLSFIAACAGCGFASIFFHEWLHIHDYSMFFILLLPIIWLISMVDSMVICERQNTLITNNINNCNTAYRSNNINSNSFNTNNNTSNNASSNTGNNSSNSSNTTTTNNNANDKFITSNANFNNNEENIDNNNNINNQTSNKFEPKSLASNITRSFEDSETLKRQNTKIIAMLLSIIPGAGHMFLKLPKQGIQLMFLFFLSLYLQNFTRLDLFLIFAPIIWFFSLFDVMHKCSNDNELVDNDLILVTWFSLENPLLQNRGKFLGWVLLLIGIFAVVERILIPICSNVIDYRVGEYAHIGIVAILFIFGGIKLLSSSKNHNY